jgi:hypothetical protein
MFEDENPDYLQHAHSFFHLGVHVPFGLVFRECKHIKNIFEDVYFTKNSFHITLIQV